jgi:hypothetical protein
LQIIIPFGEDVVVTLVAYGTAINQALKNARTSLEDLKVLRDHARAVLDAQGDLKGALRSARASGPAARHGDSRARCIRPAGAGRAWKPHVDVHPRSHRR